MRLGCMFMHFLSVYYQKRKKHHLVKCVTLVLVGTVMQSGILSHHPHAGTNRRYILNVYNERCILRNALLALRKLTNVSKERNGIQEARGLPCLCFCLSSVHYTVMGTGLERQTIALFTLGAELYQQVTSQDTC